MRQQPRFAERTGQKIVLQGQLADLGVQHLQIHRRRCLSRSTAEQSGSSLKHLTLPRCDLVGVNVILLRQFGQRLSALMAASATFALKAALCVRRALLVIVTPDMRHSRRSRQIFHLSVCPNLPGHVCYPHVAKPFKPVDLIHEAAKAITAAAENIARVKASAARLQATAEGLKDAIDESRRLVMQSKALVTGRPSAP